jgi:hypothetical protein
MGMMDTGCWILDAGYWMLDTGYWILDTGSGGLVKLDVFIGMLGMMEKFFKVGVCNDE